MGIAVAGVVVVVAEIVVVVVAAGDRTAAGNLVEQDSNLEQAEDTLAHSLVADQVVRPSDVQRMGDQRCSRIPRCAPYLLLELDQEQDG